MDPSIGQDGDALEQPSQSMFHHYDASGAVSRERLLKPPTFMGLSPTLYLARDIKVGDVPYTS